MRGTSSAIALILTLLIIGGLRYHSPSFPPLSLFLDPADGLYRLLYTSWPEEASYPLNTLSAPVRIIRDRRGVPHIFARDDRDAIVALGYVVAQDRLFQMDFITRVASGRLSEILGPQFLHTDRFLRSTGMRWGAEQNLRAIQEESGEELELLRAFIAGANAFIRTLTPETLPLEFRLLQYHPDSLTLLHPLLLTQYMAYDLSFRTDTPAYTTLRDSLGEETFEKLFPLHSRWYYPIVPVDTLPPPPPFLSPSHQQALPTSLLNYLNTFLLAEPEALASNNWAVQGSRSATGKPLVANDPHLRLTLPAIWYEVHIATPTMNIYGVTIPGAPLIIQGFNDFLGWGYTNTGADVIDYYALQLDSSATRYFYEGQWHPFRQELDTLFVRGGSFKVDTLLFTHWGPVIRTGNHAVAIRWIAHERNRLLKALWGMNHATSLQDFEEALRYWDTPMQNIIYGDVEGNIAIRSTGYLPIRGKGLEASGLLPGHVDTYTWTGRVPFEALPYSLNPEKEYLLSANQEPVGSDYPYYMRRDWPDAYRSIRLHQLLETPGKAHTVEDFQRYQQDVYVVQRALFLPLLHNISSLSPQAEQLREYLLSWDGEANRASPYPLLFDEWLHHLRSLTWDEPLFQHTRYPRQTQLGLLLREEPNLHWFDRVNTPERESAHDLIRLSLEVTADSLAVQYGTLPEAWRWENHHHLLIKHLLDISPLSRGPYPFPGFFQTLLPADTRLTTHTASWRIIMDFSTFPASGWATYPGGPSGNPFSTFYDMEIENYLNVRYHRLYKPRTPSDFAPDSVLSSVTIYPP